MSPKPLPLEVIAAAQSAQKKWGIPASISLAQYGLESGWGKIMPKGSNNPFGIKALPGEPSVTVSTHEFVAGRFVTIDAAFRKFDSLNDAFDAHAELLAKSPHYSVARTKLPDVFAFANALTGVYATDPGYGAKLCGVIHIDGLTKYDVEAVA